MEFIDRKCACLAIYNKKTNQIILGQRSDTHKWCFAGGKEEPGDFEPIDIAIRELKEEFGISLSSEQKDEIQFLGECFVKGSKRVKKTFGDDTFEPALYITNVFLVIVNKFPIPKAVDGEMENFTTVNIDDIDVKILSPSTIPVLKMVKEAVKDNGKCYMIKMEFKTGIVHEFLSEGIPKILDNCIVFNQYVQSSTAKKYTVFIDALNYYSVVPVSTKGE